MEYNFCGKSGLKLPQLSLGLWHNFGEEDNFQTAKDMICHAFDKGITHFDLANNYGSPAGSAEKNFGKILASDLSGHRDEIIVSSKAGHAMWNGPYGDGGSRKSILASVNQSLKRTGLEYFDIFYSHRYDPETPLEETVQALIDIVHQGKALYVGLSKYPRDKAEKAVQLMREQHVRCLIYQDRYSMLRREVEKENLKFCREEGIGFIAFSPLAQGVLTSRYLQGIPKDSRIAKGSAFLKEKDLNAELISKVETLNNFALERGQSLAEMSLAWVLRNPAVTSVIIGASSVGQIDDNLQAIENSRFSESELALIDSVLKGESI
ncbi:MAG: aldo/keto reductase [Dysgonamonadaceae bacterium]